MLPCCRWVGHQTLGRAQMGLGEVELAARSFQVSSGWVVNGLFKFVFVFQIFCSVVPTHTSPCDVLQEAVHLNPSDEELRKDDLEWAVGLQRERDARLQEAGSCDDVTSDGSQNPNLVKLRT